jgi:hypothetical protein
MISENVCIPIGRFFILLLFELSTITRSVVICGGVAGRPLDYWFVFSEQDYLDFTGYFIFYILYKINTS